MARAITEYIEYESLIEQINKAEQYLNEHNRELIDFYNKELSPKLRFQRELNSLKLSSEFYASIHKRMVLSPFCDFLLYIYTIPWGKLNEYDRIPHYLNTKIWERYYYDRIYNAKHYYSQHRIEDGNYYIGKGKGLNISKIIKDNLPVSEQFSDNLVTASIKSIDVWANPFHDDYPGQCGMPLTMYPFINELSYARKKSFFFLDMGITLFLTLKKLHEIDHEEELLNAEKYIPKNILEQRVISLNKQQVSPLIQFNSESGEIELFSDKMNTVYETISIGPELLDIKNESIRKQIVDRAIANLKKQNKTFVDITPDDYVALPNIYRAFLEDDVNVLRGELGELSERIMDGIVPDYIYNDDEKRCSKFLNIVDKWSSYQINIGDSASESYRASPLTYASGKYSDPKTLAEAISSGFLGLEDKGAVNDGEENDKKAGSKSFVHIPIAIGMDPLFYQSLKDSRMSRQFSYYYDMLDNSSKAVYSRIETMRKDAGYPTVMYIPPVAFLESFGGTRRGSVLKAVEKTLDQLWEIGAIKNYFKNENYPYDYKITFSENK